MSQINLTAGMRSSLLSLQNISRQVSSAQNCLATGKKVNSAIDNPSNYYTATALNNRVSDLNGLLDSMGQAVSVIKAASTALETGAAFFEQAAAVAAQALTNKIPVPDKTWFEQKIGRNDAVVTTAQELNDALAAGKETIVVYGSVDLNQKLTLRNNQKLVGIDYFGNFSGSESRFSKLNYSSNQLENMITVSGANCQVSDMSISYRNTMVPPTGFDRSAILINSGNCLVKNLDIDFVVASSRIDGAAAIKVMGGTSSAEIAGNIKINTNTWGVFFEAAGSGKISGSLDIKAVAGINAHNGSKYTMTSSAKIKIDALNVGLTVLSASSPTIESGASLYIKKAAYPIYFGAARAALTIQSGVKMAFEVAGRQEAYLLSEDFRYELADGSGPFIIKLSNISDVMTLHEINYGEVLEQIENSFKPQTTNYQWLDSKKQYDLILEQYNALIKDGSYKGTNLLKGEGLRVKFNENDSSILEVKGKDISAGALGVKTSNWLVEADIARSLAEISSAMQDIRLFSAELGNNYSIITSRQDFTQNLINILTEGADKLTLADMNEESANILALQTRQQLAINALSLVSQTSQTILKLF